MTRLALPNTTVVFPTPLTFENGWATFPSTAIHPEPLESAWSLEGPNQPRKPPGSDESQLGARSLECRQSEVQVISGVGRRQLTPDPGVSLWNNRVPKPRDEDPLVQQSLAHADRLRGFAQDHRYDGGLPGKGLEPQGQELLAEVAGVLVEPGYELSVVLEVAHRRERAAGHGGREGVREELRSGALREIVRERRGAGRKAAGGAAQCLAQRGRDDVYLAQQAVVLRRAPARAAEHAGGMRVVDGDDRVELLRQGHDVRQPGDVALHGEHAVREDQLEARMLRRAQLVLEVGHVRVPVHCRLALRDGLGEPDRIDDGRVVELVGNHDVLLAQEGRDQSLVRVPAAHVCE